MQLKIAKNGKQNYLKICLEKSVHYNSKVMKKTWKADEGEIKRFLFAWFNKKLSTITKQEI